MIKRYEKVFNEKIDFFKGHVKYETLRVQADNALMLHTGVGIEAVRAGDFMDRIIAMPVAYIRDWLDGQNDLAWRKLDQLTLKAFKGGYMDLQEQYPDVEILRISESAFKFYESLGFVVLQKNEGNCFIAKVEDVQRCNQDNTVDSIIAIAKANADAFAAVNRQQPAVSQFREDREER